ncbi:MAG: LysE family translocator [Haloferacaceae archaeon]
MAVAVSLLAGVVFGLALAAPPGPMNAIIAEESVLRGWGAGLRAGLGAMSADAVFLGLASVGAVAVVERAPAVRGAMVLVGGALMWYFAYGAARDALRADGSFAAVPPGGTADGGVSADGSDAAGRPGAPDEGGPDPEPGAAPDGPGGGESRGFAKAFVLALTNPYQVLFWLTVGVRLLAPGRIDLLSHAPYVGPRLAGVLVVATGSPALLVGLFGGIAVWVAGFPAALVAAGRRVDALAPVVAGASALVLAGFGTLFLADAAGTLAGL